MYFFLNVSYMSQLYKFEYEVVCYEKRLKFGYIMDRFRVFSPKVLATSV